MKHRGKISLIVALICFCAFFANVALGAAKRPVILNDVMEMLLLLTAAIFFVVGTLGREAAGTATDEQAQKEQA